MSAQKSSARGYLYIGAATFLWGVAATLGRAAFTGRLLPGGQTVDVDPLILSQTRVTFSFLVFLPVLALRRGWKPLWVGRADAMALSVLGIAGIAASNFFYYFAIQKTNVATAIILQYTAPVWVLIYFAALGKRRPTWNQTAAVAVGLIGIALLIDVFDSGELRLDRLGVAAALLSAFTFAFYNVFGHGILSRYDRWTVMLYVTGSAALFWMFVDPPSKIVAAHYSGFTWIFLAVFAAVSALAPFSFYAAGLQHLEPTRAMIASCMEPVFSITIAAIALGELVKPLQLAGIVLVLGAILIVEMPAGKGRAAPPLVEPIEPIE
jgi:drug/metabolite transporter (DMT)-like permease